MGFRVWGVGFKVWDLEFRVSGLGRRLIVGLDCWNKAWGWLGFSTTALLYWNPVACGILLLNDLSSALNLKKL